MKSKTKKIVILLILGLVFPIILNNNFNLNNDFKHKVDKPRTSATYDYIIIDALATTNTTFSGNWSWARAQPWCTTGDGTKENPYIIEDVTIIYPPTIDRLTIRNSRKYFTVRNCTFKDIPVATFAGIKLYNVTNANIIDNYAFNNTYGIYLDDCYNNTITGNTVSTNSLGIYLYYSDNNTVSGNTVNYNNDGIYLEESDDNTISVNIANNNADNGIYLDDNSDNNTVSGNAVNDNVLFIDNSDYNIITGNTVNNHTGDPGICLFYSDHNTVSGNTANYNGEAIDLQNSHYNNITGNTANNSTYGIYLSDCENNTISGNTANNNFNYGIFLRSNSDNNNFSGNDLNNNGDSGIYLEDCDFNSITGNNANNNTNVGISLYSSYNNTISGNTANYNNEGIYLEVSDDNTISENTANNNIIVGINLYSCYNNMVSGNTANDNGNSGIHLEGPDNDYNAISGNTLSGNNYGINIGNSVNNTIYGNFFLANGIHAMDNGTDNKWNSTKIGNYWDNWTSPDTTPMDGIVDTQYNVSGSAGGIDYLPIAEDGAPSITINSPNDSDLIGSNPPSYDVTITDDFLFEMWYTLDGGLHNYTFTEFTGTIDQSAWDAVSDGVITLTLYASDIPGNIGSAEVNIVKDATNPIIVIISPVDDEEYGTQAPFFNITITDDHLDSIWYSLDGGLTTHAITTNSTIDQTAWAALSDGLITITFYANDTLGHESFKGVIITKSTPSSPPSDPIMVFVIIIVSIIGGVALLAGVSIFMRKRASP